MRPSIEGRSWPAHTGGGQHSLPGVGRGGVAGGVVQPGGGDPQVVGGQLPGAAAAPDLPRGGGLTEAARVCACCVGLPDGGQLDTQSVGEAPPPDGGLPVRATLTAAARGSCRVWKPPERCRAPGGRISPSVRPQFGAASMLGVRAARALARSRAS